MPAKNSVKHFIEGHYYHVYNRGVDKKVIFREESDYLTFLHFLKVYLDPSYIITYKDSFGHLIDEKKPHHSYDKASLNCYCLMPNHFHLIIKLIGKIGMTDLMRKISVNYVSYYNKKYDRTGSLFGGIYKATTIENREAFNNVSRYIHLNPLEISRSNSIFEYPYSSLKHLVNHNVPKWLDLSPYGEENEKDYYIKSVKLLEAEILKNGRADTLKESFDTIKQLILE